VEGRTGWEIPWRRGVDIDSFEDWELAEALFRL
jgi:CMP-N-acetylneuraminic acid synthetase